MTASAGVTEDGLRAVGETCGVCLRSDAPAIGRMSGMSAAGGARYSRTTADGARYSAPCCADCALLLFAGDWDGLRRLVLAWKVGGASVPWLRRGYRRACRDARTVVHCNRHLFANLTNPNDAPHERSAR